MSDITVPKVQIEIKKVKLTKALLQQMPVNKSPKVVFYVAENNTAICSLSVRLSSPLQVEKLVSTYVLAVGADGDYVLIPDYRWTDKKANNRVSIPNDNELYCRVYWKAAVTFDDKGQRDKYLKCFNEIMEAPKAYI